MPPSLEQLAEYAEHFNRGRVAQYFGVRVSFPSTERVRADLEVLPGHRGGLGTSAVNGGVLAALFDLVLGLSSALVDPTRASATQQLSMTFERPTTGNSVHAEASVSTATSRTLYTHGEIYDEKGQVTARASGVVRLSREKWTHGAPGHE